MTDRWLRAKHDVSVPPQGVNIKGRKEAKPPAIDAHEGDVSADKPPRLTDDCPVPANDNGDVGCKIVWERCIDARWIINECGATDR
jgi:hypothetical protein